MLTVDITSANADNQQLRRLYESAFPVEEQIPYDDLKLLMDTMPISFTAYYDDTLFVGLTIVLNSNPFKWGWYFAVQPDLRGKGYGNQILTMLREQYANVPFVIDIESPNQKNCKNREQRLRRYGFYKRSGFRDTPTAKTFDGIEYTILLQGEGTFTQKDYDDMINQLRKYWTRIPKESHSAKS